MPPRAVRQDARMTTRRATPCKSLALNFTHGGNVPEWIEVLPAGPEIIGRDGRYWIIDDPQAIIAKSELPLHVDYEHASEVRAPKGEEAPAAGWIDKLEVRDGRIWAHVDWTPRASAMIAEREYRFISPTFWFDSNTLRIVGLVSVALTNRPNLTMTALNAQDDETSADASGHPKRNTGEKIMDKEQLKALCKKLGLQEEASATAILAAVDTLIDDKTKAMNAAQTPPLEKFVPRADYDKIKGDLDTANNAIKAANEAKLDAEITSAVDEAVKAGKVTPASRDYYLAQCRKDGGLAEFKTFVAAAPVLTGVSDLDTRRANNSNADRQLTAEEKAVCSAMGLTEEAFKKAAA
jgi:phage I-like protein